MLAALLVFVVVSALVAGAGVYAMRLPEILANRRMAKRLHEVSKRGDAADDDQPQASFIRESKAGPLPALDKAFGGTNSSLARLIEQSGVIVAPSTIILASMMIALAASVVALAFSPNSQVLYTLGARFEGCQEACNRFPWVIAAREEPEPLRLWRADVPGWRARFAPLSDRLRRRSWDDMAREIVRTVTAVPPAHQG